MTLIFLSPPFTNLESLILTTSFALLYVGSLYVSKHARLSFVAKVVPPPRDGAERRRHDSERWRDDPDVIRARLIAVTIVSLVSCTIVFGALWQSIGPESIEVTLEATLVRLGFSMPEFSLDALLPHLITPLLFLGPLYALYLDFSSPYPATGSFKDVLFSWQGTRNYVVAPITEEIVFRACVLAVYNLSGASKTKMIMLAPLSFGVAHVHHAWDIFNRYGRTPAAAKRALLTALFQLSYTTLFGSFVSYLFLRTGSIFPPITAHIFCNVMGLPQLGYEVSKFPKQKRFIYLAYMTGVLGFVMKLVPWTNTPYSLYWQPRGQEMTY
ncbi:peptidase U48 family protein [Pleurotus pulmonarius]